MFSIPSIPACRTGRSSIAIKTGLFSPKASFSMPADVVGLTTNGGLQLKAGMKNCWRLFTLEEKRWFLFAEVDGRLTTTIVPGRLVVDGKGGSFATAGYGRLITDPGLAMGSLSPLSLRVWLFSISWLPSCQSSSTPTDVDPISMLSDFKNMIMHTEAISQ
jgi:hypothetical protein